MKVDYNLALVKKANSLIEASFKLTVNEQKLILMLTTSVKKDDQDFASYTIPVKEFAKGIGLTEKCNIYQRVETLVAGLQKKVLTIHDTVEINNVQKERIQCINWLSYSSYIKGEGLIELCFHPKLKPYLLNLKARFTSYKFKEVAQLRSRFSIRIYEFIRQYETLRQRTFKLEDLRKIFKIDPEQYHPYFNFKSRVLLVAQRELTKNSNLTFDFEEIKIGKKVEKIRFTIKKNTPPGMCNASDIHDIITVDNECSELENLIKQLPANYQQQKSLSQLLEKHLAKHDFDYVSRNITYANANSNAVVKEKNLFKKSNYRGYLTKALNNDFGLAFQEDKAITEEQNKLREKVKADQQKQLQAEKIAANMEEKQREIIKNHLALLPAGEIKKLETEAIQAMDEGVKNIVINNKTGWRTNLQLKMNEVLRKRLFSD